MAKETVALPRYSKARPMPIYRLLQNSGFEPSEVEALAEAFEMVCRELNLAGKKEPLRDLVAQKVIDFAERGARDADRIGRLVLADLRGIGPAPESD